MCPALLLVSLLFTIAAAARAAGGATALGGAGGLADDPAVQELTRLLIHNLSIHASKLQVPARTEEVKEYRSPSSQTRAKGAADTIAALDMKRKMATALPAGSAGDAALNAAVLADIGTALDETSMLSKLSTSFRELLELPEEPDDLGLILVNSELLQWLKPELGKECDPQFYLKPDWFLTWKPFVKFHSAAGRGGLRDGRLASTRLQYDGCVAAFFEGKRDAITNESLGQLISYHDAMMGQCNGIALCKENFSLYRSLNTHPELLMQSIAWSAAGSKAAIKSHFSVREEPALLKALRLLLTHFSLSLDYSRFGGAFLGAGAVGRVFAVKDRFGFQRALKVVLYNDQRVAVALHHERTALHTAATLGAPVVAPLEASGVHMEEADFGNYAGYVLSKVGSPADVPATLPQQRRAFTALAKLHARGIVHGDARLANLLTLPEGDGLAWVDFMGSHSPTVKSIKDDVLALLSGFHNVPATATAGIEGYASGMMSLIASKQDQATTNAAAMALVAVLFPD